MIPEDRRLESSPALMTRPRLSGQFPKTAHLAPPGSGLPNAGAGRRPAGIIAMVVTTWAASTRVSGPGDLLAKIDLIVVR